MAGGGEDPGALLALARISAEDQANVEAEGGIPIRMAAGAVIIARSPPYIVV